MLCEKKSNHYYIFDMVSESASSYEGRNRSSHEEVRFKTRGIRPGVFFKINVLKTWQNSQGKTPVSETFLTRFPGWNLKKETLGQLLFCEFCEIFPGKCSIFSKVTGSYEFFQEEFFPIYNNILHNTCHNCSSQMMKMLKPQC